MVSSGLRRALKGTCAPTAVVDLDAFDENLDALAQRARGLPIRLATKSLRVPAAIDRALAHPAYSGVLAFSVPEALSLHARGVRDIVIGYPSLDRPALTRMVAEAGARSNITVMIDSVDHLDIIDDVRRSLAEAGAASVRVCIDVDSSFRPAESCLGDRVHIGARRSPIRDGRAAVALARQVAARPGFDLVGMMFYEGQIAGTADAGRTARQAIVRLMQRASIAELAERRAAVIAAVREVADLEFVNGGGTGSFESSSVEGTLTELAAGSGLFSPGLFDGYTHFRHRPAAYFVTPVVRRPGPGWVTVFKGGFIASGVPGPDRLPTIAWPPGLEYSGLEGPGEVQTPLTGPGTDSLRIGDLVWFRHAKAGELAEHFNDFQIVSQGRIRDAWTTYRGEGLVL
ncbi:amino acid deaminase/aldolase [Brevibacterium linens]|uniref:D-serine deaminase, pyridoxal phosphate-dependent n=1 Tax=Brevibacterium linens TaxID=1703 RepID=A0A2H1I9B1_BRELN|nr:amino acid deaminase/aldolase [Brevibacterium linens]SMX71622.1 D-serine deaminase, pyridoxal phosphate-dependent [Brevibacterium linens]